MTKNSERAAPYKPAAYASIQTPNGSSAVSACSTAVYYVSILFLLFGTLQCLLSDVALAILQISSALSHSHRWPVRSWQSPGQRRVYDHLALPLPQAGCMAKVPPQDAD